MVKGLLPTAQRAASDGDDVADSSLLLEGVVRRINAATGGILRDEDLTLEQWRVLDCLVRRGEMPMTELAGVVLTPAPTVTRIVDKLVSRALVTGRPP